MKVGGARLIGNLDKQEEHRFLVMVIHNFAKKLGLPLPPPSSSDTYGILARFKRVR